MEIINFTGKTIRIAIKNNKRIFTEVEPSEKMVVIPLFLGYSVQQQINEDEYPFLFLPGGKEEPFPEIKDDIYYIVPSYIKAYKKLLTRPDVVSCCDYEEDKATNILTCYSFYA
jgi:hypothetical protein